MAMLQPTLPATARRAAALLAAVLAVGCTSSSPSPPPVAPAATQTASPGASGAGAASPSAEASQAGSTIPPLPTGPDRLRVELHTAGLTDPIGITHAGDGSGRLFVNERAGRVRVITGDGSLLEEPFVDLSNRVLFGNERGLLGLAFHPDFAANGRLFVHYSRAGDGATVVSELQASTDRDSADPDSERQLLSVAQPFANHNGGQLAFGPDGYLYIGLGDGGSGGDPLGNGQNRNVLLGKILRLDVDRQSAGDPYGIPADNPFAAGGADPGAGLPEIWAYGLRNPWRFSFDPEGGAMYIGDVGQGSWEEIDRQPGDSRGGENYGWSVMEGRQCFQFDCDQAPYVKPIAQYSHEVGCAVAAGHVYRGNEYPELDGVYVFADYCSGIFFTLQIDEGTISPKQVLDSELRVTAFGVSETGELYAADLNGAIYRVRVD
jgi:glucose/arabinose dehydrogenase